MAGVVDHPDLQMRCGLAVFADVSIGLGAHHPIRDRHDNSFRDDKWSIRTVGARVPDGMSSPVPEYAEPLIAADAADTHGWCTQAAGTIGYRRAAATAVAVSFADPGFCPVTRLPSTTT
ncbi:hypothetical protein GCM10027169_27580 [Gordonia jinhuaensis]|uniref:Uncharacterized protein n=1 Tax=Gordonia jinhuaensis TaxID=1517702 RepID=A0A916TCF6_9ACTN|nr:hypothetical protein GCM10011489_26550 [Gordonia jinhuaensis]